MDDNRPPVRNSLDNIFEPVAATMLGVGASFVPALSTTNPFLASFIVSGFALPAVVFCADSIQRPISSHFQLLKDTYSKQYCLVAGAGSIAYSLSSYFFR